MIILSVDYGDTRTGIAVCDKTEFLASPVTVITEKETITVWVRKTVQKESFTVLLQIRMSHLRISRMK